MLPIWPGKFDTLNLTKPWHVQVAKRLFDVDIVPADGEVPVWHPDVRFFKLMSNGERKSCTRLCLNVQMAFNCLGRSMLESAHHVTPTTCLLVFPRALQAPPGPISTLTPTAAQLRSAVVPGWPR